MDIISQSCDQNLSYVSELRNLLEDEWGPFDAFEQEKGGVYSPSPIIAIENRNLVGGLVFSVWNNPEAEGYAVWVNGVIVKQGYRGKGVASRLVNRATLVMAGCSQPTLYVKSSIDELYLKNGWRAFSKVDSETIFKYQV